MNMYKAIAIIMIFIASFLLILPMIEDNNTILPSWMMGSNVRLLFLLLWIIIIGFSLVTLFE